MAANKTEGSYKERARNLVQALLKYADEKPQLSQQKPEVQVRWDSPTTLLVTGERKDKHGKSQQGTKSSDLLELIEEYGTLEEGVKKTVGSLVRPAREELKKCDLFKDLRDKKSRKNSRYWKFRLELKGKDCSLEENLEYVEIKLGISSPESKSSNTINWHDTCKKRLENQRRATSNHLMGDESAKKHRHQIYVPLALVQKKKKWDKRPKVDLSPDAGTSLYEPEYETTQRFEHDAFLSQILEGGEGKSKGKRIALIGEPGAGKTTLLQTIADWVLNGKLGFPVWISLADLVRKENVTEIQEYIQNTWLKQAFFPTELTEEITTDFGEQIKQGKVWLLLDGVDEMLGGKASCQPLEEISRQLNSWINYSRVVLTCRLNVWQADSNKLENFETYRLLDFDYPQQVQQFIDNWFEKDGQKGERLKAELDQPQRSRLQDLVQTPLRLTLLCSIWEEEEGNLPRTKAGLYSRYQRSFYHWKQEEFSTTTEQQRELDSALGCLAWRDINEGSSRFRMRESFIVKELGDPDDKDSNFYKALKIGWLNHVGYAAESDSQEKVYAFYHATFEEYFAALAIENRNDFLHHVPNDRKAGTYRLFEPEWQEVILLWLGKENVDYEQKNKFIQSLIEFPRECGDFYWYRAYFLAAMGVAEFSSCQHTEKIVERILSWGYLEERNSVIGQKAREVLLQTERGKAIAALLELLAQTQDDYTRELAAKSLGQIGTGNPEAIESLCALLADNSLDNQLRYQVAESLGQIDRGNTKAIKSLSDLLYDKSLNFPINYKVVKSLEEIGTGNPEAIESLCALLADNSLDNEIRRKVAKSLEEIGRGNTKVIKFLCGLLADNSLDNEIRREVAESLGQIDRGNTKAINSLCDLLADKSVDSLIRWQVVYSFDKIGRGNTKVIKFLCGLLADNLLEADLGWRIAESLEEIGRGSPEAIKLLCGLLDDNSLDNDNRVAVAGSLGIIDRGNTKAINSLSGLLANNSLDNVTRWIGAYHLGRINTGNTEAINSLCDLLADNSLDNEIRPAVAISLATIDRGNTKAFNSLCDILYDKSLRYFLEEAVEHLVEFSRGNREIIKFLCGLLADNSLDNDIRRHVAYGLGEFGRGNREVIKFLCGLLADNSLNNLICWLVAYHLGRMDTGNTEAINSLCGLLANQSLELEEYLNYKQVAECLGEILTEDRMPFVVAELQQYSESNTDIYKLIWNCAQVLPYAEFDRAWNSTKESLVVSR